MRVIFSIFLLLALHLPFTLSITYVNPTNDVTCGADEDCIILCNDSGTFGDCTYNRYYIENSYPSPYKKQKNFIILQLETF